MLWCYFRALGRSESFEVVLIYCRSQGIQTDVLMKMKQPEGGMVNGIERRRTE